MSTPTTSSFTASASKWRRPWPRCGTCASVPNSGTWTRTGRRWPAYSARSIGVGATPGVTPCAQDLEDNARVAKLLGADRLGIECDEDTGWQYHPEQTTSAIICHHPQAKYFVAR